MSTEIQSSSKEAEHLKSEVKLYWNADPCGTQFTNLERGSSVFYDEVERYRYLHNPFMLQACKFSQCSGKKLLEIGSGLGTDSVQFARSGAHVTCLDLTPESIALAKKHFEIRGLEGEFVVGDAENLPFPDNIFDIVYSFGVLHHTPDTPKAIQEVYRVLKPGGEAIIMLYHKNSLHVYAGVPYHFLTGLLEGKLRGYDDWIRIYDGPNNPLGKAYSKSECRTMFAQFSSIDFAVFDHYKRNMSRLLNNIHQQFTANKIGFNLMIYAKK
jgi:ubiquinone/menaquinone biosynthesis C-methylase UbiE